MKKLAGVFLLILLCICLYSQEKSNKATDLIMSLNGTIEIESEHGYVVKLPEHRSYIENLKMWVDVWVNENSEDVEYGYPWMKRKDDYILVLKVGTSQMMVLSWEPKNKTLYITNRGL